MGSTMLAVLIMNRWQRPRWESTVWCTPWAPKMPEKLWCNIRLIPPGGIIDTQNVSQAWSRGGNG